MHKPSGIFFLIAAVLAFGATPCRAICLEEANAFADHVCGAIQQGGSSTVFAVSGQLSAEAKGWVSKLLGSARAGVNGETVEKNFEGVVQEQLGTERSSARQCRENMAKFAAKQVCEAAAQGGAAGFGCENSKGVRMYGNYSHDNAGEGFSVRNGCDNAEITGNISEHNGFPLDKK